MYEHEYKLSVIHVVKIHFINSVQDIQGQIILGAIRPYGQGQIGTQHWH